MTLYTLHQEKHVFFSYFSVTFVLFLMLYVPIFVLSFVPIFVSCQVLLFVKQALKQAVCLSVSEPARGRLMCCLSNCTRTTRAIFVLRLPHVAILGNFRDITSKFPTLPRFYNQDKNGSSWEAGVGMVEQGLGMDKFQKEGLGSQYLENRNRHGAGYSFENSISGHDAWLIKTKPICGWNGKEWGPGN